MFLNPLWVHTNAEPVRDGKGNLSIIPDFHKKQS